MSASAASPSSVALRTPVGSSHSIIEAFLIVRQQLDFDAEIEELRAAAIAPHRILALYPLDVRKVADWLFGAVGAEQSAITKFSEEIVATTTVTSCHKRAKFEVGPTSLDNGHLVAFYKDGYEDLIHSKAGHRWADMEVEPSKPYSSWAQRFVAELLWVSVHWNDLPELHGWEQAHVNDLLLLAKLVTEAKNRKAVAIEHRGAGVRR